jgi:hypothetical protein
MADTKTKPTPAKRTEADILAEIFRLSWELEDRHARKRIQQAVQDARDRRNGKDW